MHMTFNALLDAQSLIELHAPAGEGRVGGQALLLVLLTGIQISDPSSTHLIRRRPVMRSFTLKVRRNIQQKQLYS